MPKKLTNEYVFNYYNEEKYILTSIYNGAHNKDKIICPNGHHIEMRFSGFKFGYRCKKCSGKEKHSQEYIYKYYINEQYTLNSIYKNALNKDKLTCPVGHKIEIKFNDFQQGVRCKICFFKNNCGENNPKYNPDRTRQIRTEYLKFDLKRINILNDEPLYNEYINSKVEAKDSNYIWNKTSYTVDHIFPRVAFIDNNLDILYNKKLIKEICNSRDNLRIIHKKDNGSKAGKYNQEEFMKWFKIQLYLEENIKV
jgi:hypothetical protein